MVASFCYFLKIIIHFMYVNLYDYFYSIFHYLLWQWQIDKIMQIWKFIFIAFNNIIRCPIGSHFLLCCILHSDITTRISKLGNSLNLSQETFNCTMFSFRLKSLLKQLIYGYKVVSLFFLLICTYKYFHCVPWIGILFCFKKFFPLIKYYYYYISLFAWI